MYFKSFRPIVFLLVIVALVSLACGIDWGTSTSEPPVQQPQQPQPQQPSQPQPTEPPAQPSGQQFYTENFDAPNDNWTYFTVKGDDSTNESALSLKTEGGYLSFDITTNYLYTYVMYGAFEYDNVRVDARVENRGSNNNNISLICRYSDEGWYEFNVANNGLYNIYVATYNPSGEVVYNFLADGGSNKIRSGKEVNEYSIICKDRTLTLYINGIETRVLDDNKFVLRGGQVGISVSSFNDLPVKVDVDWIKISQP